ncbi:expressed unknown protein [Seminavis robusta]|uniref:Uncharacterized protein n=1 Tax=Seminavis robusta TaxID=568900 RepID=A0A9N8EBT6_9STRA|nr:expressed unknown protein [Seminavis robusta]|eukprot:Sro720_g192530.1 n/a (311) ;mRNA; f:10649-11581
MSSFSIVFFVFLFVILATGTDSRDFFVGENLNEKELDDFLADDARAERRELEEGTGGLFDACNDDKPCQGEGLSCVTWVTRKRCVPIDCLKQELTNFQNSFDGQGYIQQVSAEAGLDNPNRLPEWLGGGGNNSGISRDIQNSGRREALLKAISNHTEFHEQVSSIGQKCFLGNSANVVMRNADSKQASLSWYGLHLEAGIIPDFSWSCYSVDGYDTEFSRFCLGAELGAGFFYGILSGWGWSPVSGTPDELLNCGSLMADLDVGLVTGIGLAAGATLSGVLFYEVIFAYFPNYYAIGAGVGAAVCGTSSS